MLFAQTETLWLERLVNSFSNSLPAGSFFWYSHNWWALFALICVSCCCGAVGSLVVGGRLAFFSDALAHCAFAGVSVGFLFFQLVLAGTVSDRAFWQYVTPVMVGFGILVGLGIATVRQQTGLASDTVIGVFFAGAIGLAATLRGIIRDRSFFDLDDFLFGDLLNVTPDLVVGLLVLTLVTFVVLAGIYNFLLLASFNSSLALSRRVPVQLANTIFIVLLAIVVNVCLRCVGALLINALLIVPAATAANVSRNMRQMFWLTIVLCLSVSLLGMGLSWEIGVRTRLKIGTSGTIVLLSVFLFFVSMSLAPLLRKIGTAPLRRA